MSIEQRIAMLGRSLLLELDENNKATYTNDTGYELIVLIEGWVYHRMEDANANYSDYHWHSNMSVISTSGEDKNIIIAYGGSNNKQYDHVTWDSCSRIETVKILNGDSLTVQFSLTQDGGTSGNTGFEVKGIIVGVPNEAE